MIKRKIVIIGLDGASLNLIRPWVDQGYLPNFKKVLESGSFGKLRTIIPPYTAPAWTTLYTGKNPGKHGLIDFIGLRPDSYDIVPTSFADNKAQTFWEIAGSFGKKVAILNTPFTYPLKKVNGVIVSGLQTPEQATDFTYPNELKQQLDELTKGYKIFPIVFDGNRNAYLESLYEIAEKKFKVFLHYLQQSEWDLFMCVLQGTDLIQHHFWQFMDSTHPHYKSDNKYKDVIRQFYQKIDSYLGEFMRHIDEQTTLILNNA